MTTLAPRTTVASGSREAGIVYWSARALAFAAIVACVATALPDAPALALARWDGARIVHDGIGVAGAGWLGALVAWCVAAGGTSAMLAAASAVAVVTFALVETRARSRGGRLFALAAIVVAALCSLDALRAGGLAAAVLTAALALALERGGSRRAALAGAIALVWCNVSADGVLAPLVALAYALGATLGGAEPAERRQAWYAAGACALAIFATPAFAAIPFHALASLRIERSLAGIVAMHPVDVAPLGYRIGFPLVVLAFLALGSRTRIGMSDAVLATFATVLALANGAFLPVFGVLVAPVLAGIAFETFGSRGARDAAIRPADAFVVAAALVLGAALAPAAGPRADAAVAAQPYALVGRAPVASGPHRFYCATVDWCDFALAEGAPGTSVLVDSRLGSSVASVLAAQRAISHASRGWRAILDRERIDAMLVRRDRALATLLRARGDWAIVASDATADVFLRVRAPR